MLDNFDNLQASWVTQGGKVGQLSLAYGANDMGSVMIEENVVRAAGASYCMDEVEIVRNIEDAGFIAKRRNMHYEILGDPIFREREVPRMLELATARAEGDTHRARGAAQLPGRAAAPGKQLARHFSQLIRYHASWILPIASRRSATAGLRSIAAASSASAPAPPARALDASARGRSWPRGVLPGLVNAHTHLELSYLRDSSAAPTFIAWIRGVMAARRQRPIPQAPEILDAIDRAIAESVALRDGGGRRHQQHAGDL